MLLNPELSTLLDGLGFLSPDSRCQTFDKKANGYARGEGVVALFVKPLKEALRNGDVIRAIVRATGSNQDGRTPGLTQPSAKAQESLIRHVYAAAGLDFGQTAYVEAHGKPRCQTLPNKIEQELEFQPFQSYIRLTNM